MESRILALPLLVVVYLVFRLLKRTFLKWKLGATDAPYIPGTGLFFTRSPKEMLRVKSEGLLLKEVCEQFIGTVGTNRLKIFRPVLSTNDPENIKAILATQFNDFALGTRHAHFMPLLGDGIFTLDGHGWKQSRSMLRPNFSREKVAHTKALEVHLQNLAKHIKKHNGEPFDIQDYFFRFTVDTATEFLFGHSLFGLMDASIGEVSPNLFEGSDKFYSAFNKSQEICASRAWLQDFYWLINPKEFKECNKIVHNFAKFYIDKALNIPDEELEKLSQDGYIFLYELVKSTKDPNVLRDQLLNIMIAGRDTTAGLLTMTFYELSKNPEVFRRLKEAIYNDFGDNETVDLNNITFESLKKCEYLKHVINETLRLYPNVPLNFRVATRNTTLPRGGGPDGSKPVLVERGETVGYSIFATHRDPKYYGKDANEFRPDRWTSDLKPGWAYLPFNGGPRICLGQQFALTEASYAIVRLIQMFPNLVSEDRCEVYPPTLNSQLTISLKEGNYIRMY